MGSHKTVYEGAWRGMRVAALRVRAAGAEVAREVAILRALARHPGLPHFHGVARDAGRGVWLIAELLSLGALDSQLEAWASIGKATVAKALVEMPRSSRAVRHPGHALRKLLVEAPLARVERVLGSPRPPPGGIPLHRGGGPHCTAAGRMD